MFYFGYFETVECAVARLVHDTHAQSSSHSLCILPVID